jgi:hypothetical protein
MHLRARHGRLPGAEYDRYYMLVRSWGFRIVTPYRLGVAVGKSGANLPNPYTGARSANCYTAGVEWGREVARKEVERLAEDE